MPTETSRNVNCEFWLLHTVSSSSVYQLRSAWTAFSHWQITITSSSWLWMGDGAQGRLGSMLHFPRQLWRSWFSTCFICVPHQSSTGDLQRARTESASCLLHWRQLRQHVPRFSPSGFSVRCPTPTVAMSSPSASRCPFHTGDELIAVYNDTADV